MNKIIIFLLLGINIMPAQAKTLEVQLPSIAGPEIYELYTDTKMYITKVYVNGFERKLSNAEGNGYIQINEYSYNGPHGYYNKTYLNAHMKEGKNKIKVVFKPSPTIKEIIQDGAQKLFLKKMFARAVITKGQLTDNSFGMETENLDKLVKAPPANIEILYDKYITNIKEDKITKSITMTFTIDVTGKETSRSVHIHDCEGDINSSNNFTGELLLNGTPILKIKDTVSSILVDLNHILKPVDVELELRVESINSKKKSYFKYRIACDMEKIIDLIELKSTVNHVYFGDFFNVIYIELMNIKFDKPGIYKRKFEYYY